MPAVSSHNHSELQIYVAFNEKLGRDYRIKKEIASIYHQFVITLLSLLVYNFYVTGTSMAYTVHMFSVTL